MLKARRPVRYTPQPWQLRLIQAIAVGGIVLAFFMHLFHEGLIYPSCGSEENWAQRLGIQIDCYNVSGSTAKYATLDAFPVLEAIPVIRTLSVAQAGLIGYILIFGLIWLGDVVDGWARFGRILVPWLVIGAFLFTLWLTWVEAVVIGAFCLYCLYSAGLVLAMLIPALLLLVRK